MWSYQEEGMPSARCSFTRNDLGNADSFGFPLSVSPISQRVNRKGTTVKIFQKNQKA